MAASIRKAIIINGLPASGKTTIGVPLSNHFNAPLITLDTIKEAMFDGLGIGDREYNRKLGMITRDIIWRLQADFPKDVITVLDIWMGFPPYYNFKEGLEKAGIDQFVEIWCHAPGEVLAKRYLDRVDKRHKGHPGADYVPELMDVALRAQPMRLSPCLEIETTDLSIIDIPKVIAWVEKELDIH